MFNYRELTTTTDMSIICNALQYVSSNKKVALAILENIHTTEDILSVLSKDYIIKVLKHPNTSSLTLDNFVNNLLDEVGCTASSNVKASINFCLEQIIQNNNVSIGTLETIRNWLDTKCYLYSVVCRMINNTFTYSIATKS